jgi:hypothetical protein
VDPEAAGQPAGGGRDAGDEPGESRQKEASAVARAETSS